MCLYIKDASDNYVYMRYLIGSVVNNPDIPLKGESATLEWNGLGNQGSYSGQPLPPGNYTVTLYINKSGYTAYETNPLTIFGVDNVQWEEYPGNDTINDNKIFPGKYSYSDSDPDRKKIRVVATLTEELSNIQVYYKYFDVDDPSSSDPGGSADTSGPDNYAIGKNQGEGFLNGGVNGSGVTDGSGITRSTFKVSMQPGDNFRIAASLDENLLNTPYLTQAMADSGSPPAGVVFSPILTVWRKLHVETDSMQAVATSGAESNQVVGTAESPYNYNSGTNETTVDLQLDLEDWWEETKSLHFENGSYKPGATTPHTPLRTIWHDGDDEIVVQGNCTGDPFSYVLRDDDDFTLLHHYSDPTILSKVFSDCYIDCVLDAPGSNVNIPFKRNPGGKEFTPQEGADFINQYRNSAPYEADDYWIVYIASIFQMGYSEDGDPDSEFDVGVVPTGITDPTHHEFSLIPLEHIRDAFTIGMRPIAERQSVAHEIGHQILESSNHTPNTIMNESITVSPIYDEHFSPADIAIIRSKVSSPGH